MLHLHRLARSARRTLSRPAAACLLGLAAASWGGPAAAVAADSPKRPFPQFPAYAAGSIRPNHVTRPALARKVTRFYAAWKSAFLRGGCGPGRYYVYLGPQPPTAEGVPISVSEGQGYGMAIVAYMAGHDREARQIFDGLYGFYRDHPSRHDGDLMAWRQLAGCQSSSDRNSASDGDLTIAYALLLADAQWGSAGPIDYRARAHALLAAIQRREVHPASGLPQLGDWVHPAHPREHEAVRPSDLAPGQFRAFWRATGDRRWKAALDGSYRLLDRMQREHAPATGLLPDFLEQAAGSPRPAAPGFKGEPQAGVYSFNACRVPWLVAVDYLASGDGRAKAVVGRIEDWIVAATGGDVYRLYAGYELNGTPTVGYSHVCFTGAVGIGAMVDARHQTWVNRIWDDIALESVDTPGDSYGASLRALYLIAMSGNWWTPAPSR